MSTEPSIAHRLVESHRSYAHAIAGEILRKLPSHVEKDDIQGAAELGLTEAANTFDGRPAFGSKHSVTTGFAALSMMRSAKPLGFRATNIRS